MGKYTLETLKSLNILYDRRYKLTQSDVDVVNEFVDLIEKSRLQETPVLGDIVRYKKQVGQPFELAHIERVKGKKLLISEDSDPRLISLNLFGKLSTAVLDKNLKCIPNRLKFLRKESAPFYLMGYEGAWRTGKIKFYADVNVWELCESKSNSTIVETKNLYRLPS